MAKAIIGYKAGMTRIFDERGGVIPVTVIQAGPNVVTQVKTVEKDGYAAYQLAFDEVAEKRAETVIRKPERGHFKKYGVAAHRHIRELKLDGEYKSGDVIKADIFSAGEHVDITGTSKGKGYQGVIKRYGAHRTPMSHGGGPVHRHQGSMAANTDPSRVFPGKIMPGHMGAERVTALNLTVVKVDAELGVICVKGAVPGPNKGLVVIRNTVKKIKSGK